MNTWQALGEALEEGVESVALPSAFASCVASFAALGLFPALGLKPPCLFRGPRPKASLPLSLPSAFAAQGGYTI